MRLLKIGAVFQAAFSYGTKGAGYVMVFRIEPTYLVKTQIYYGFSFAAAAIYWFWDSIFLQKKK